MLAPVTMQAAADPAIERRQRPRLPVETPVLVVALAESGLAAVNGSMVDVSGGGARIATDGGATFARGTELLLVDVVDGRQRLVRVVDSRPGSLHLSFAENEAASPSGG